MPGFRQWTRNPLTTLFFLAVFGYLLFIQTQFNVMKTCQSEDTSRRNLGEFKTSKRPTTHVHATLSPNLVHQSTLRAEPVMPVMDRLPLQSAPGEEEVEWVRGIRQQKNAYVQLKGSNVYLYTAFASNSTRGSKWDKFVINAWEHADNVNTTYSCCFLFQNFDVESNRMNEKLSYYIKAKLNAKQIVCNRTGISGDHVEWLAVAKTGKSCPESVAEYLPIKYLYRPTRKTFGVSGKIVHGNKDPQELVEWFEFQKLFGVDKIIMYPLNNLNNISIQVLRHYEKSGLVEIAPFHSVPMSDAFKRSFTDGNNIYKFNDLQVMVFDSEERLKEYTYAILMDTDEFLVPTDTRISTYVQLMETLLTSKVQQTGFMFYDQLYLKTWGKTNAEDELYISQYLNRTAEIMDRPKIMFVPERTQQGTMEIHGMKGKPRYKSVSSVPRELAVLKHYRNCREDWAAGKCHNFTKITDTSMKTIGDIILPHVRDVRRRLGF